MPKVQREGGRERERERERKASAVAKSVVKSFALGNVCARNPATVAKVGPTTTMVVGDRLWMPSSMMQERRPPQR